MIVIMYTAVPNAPYLHYIEYNYKNMYNATVLLQHSTKYYYTVDMPAAISVSYYTLSLHSNTVCTVHSSTVPQSFVL